MFNLGFSELILLGIIALIFIGPKELPEIARTIGRFLNELKRTTGDLASTVLKPDERLRDELQKVVQRIEEPLPPHEGDKLESPPADEKPWSHESHEPSATVDPTEKPKGEA